MDSVIDETCGRLPASYVCADCLHYCLNTALGSNMTPWTEMLRYRNWGMCLNGDNFNERCAIIKKNMYCAYWALSGQQITIKAKVCFF